MKLRCWRSAGFAALAFALSAALAAPNPPAGDRAGAVGALPLPDAAAPPLVAPSPLTPAPLGPRVAPPGAGAGAPPPQVPGAVVPTPQVPGTPPQLSLSARKIYEQSRSRLVQIRTLLKGRASQTSVGSGFFVTPEGHIVSNFHVVADAALKPERHDLVYVTADGREAPVQILQIDVLHDLALLKAADPQPRSFESLEFRPEAEALAQGERIYSLGNPLDVGFAFTQGTYNGMVRRSFYPQIFFGGALSAGMSGGPALDEEGRVVGINVARRGDGEQVSFLVPATFASQLLARGRNVPPIATPAYPVVAAQLRAHQDALTERFIRQGWKSATHPRLQVPVPPDVFMRCWGTSEVSKTGGLDFERSDCAMESRIFAGELTTGVIELRHETYDGSRLGTLRFTARYSASFRNELFVRPGVTQHQTKPTCHEDYVDREGLTLRAVVCLRAYKKLPQLFDVAVLVATLDQPQSAVLGRFDAQGVTFENAQRLARHYIGAYRWNR
ncbi:S1C family serine protease [Piscinibacter koreensis]|uniref:Trypsin-like peptidase domain-containing protein n=1 Tax=Piscinibacter koreensis TaxID=2742824 RepID=A0A7Y6TUQ2_9BURK|nr:serine protease [Schlegelella koreensis]NUZ04279.1 trypsin-like peptidase domain-containing protein [Schlegelella koreensis]